MNKSAEWRSKDLLLLISLNILTSPLKARKLAKAKGNVVCINSTTTYQICVNLCLCVSAFAPLSSFSSFLFPSFLGSWVRKLEWGSGWSLLINLFIPLGFCLCSVSSLGCAGQWSLPQAPLPGSLPQPQLLYSSVALLVLMSCWM